jgi:hypothetical protein
LYFRVFMDRIESCQCLEPSWRLFTLVVGREASALLCRYVQSLSSEEGTATKDWFYSSTVASYTNE